MEISRANKKNNYSHCFLRCIFNCFMIHLMELLVNATRLNVINLFVNHAIESKSLESVLYLDHRIK